MGSENAIIFVGFYIYMFVCCVVPWIVTASLLSSGNPTIVNSYSSGLCTVIEVDLRSDPCGSGKNEQTETRAEFHVYINTTGEYGLAVEGKWGLRGRGISQSKAYNNHATGETYACWYPPNPQEWPATACTVSKSDRLIYDNFDGAEMLKQVFITAVVLAPVCCCFCLLSPLCFYAIFFILSEWSDIKTFILNRDQKKPTDNLQSS
jgi:hypothetical protein